MDSIIGTIIFFITGLVTYKGFSDEQYKERYLFDVDKILIGREFDRLLSSGFLHGSWMHFVFNMAVLITFSLSIEYLMGIPKYLIIYFGSLIGGNLLALYIHRNHGDYKALGASGAVSGIILSSIILFPHQSINLFIFDLHAPAWIIAILYILFSIFGLKKQLGNIGHDAHLGGATIGVLLTIILQPSILKTNWWIVLLILVPVLSFLILIIKKPEVMMIDQYWGFDKKAKPTKQQVRRNKEVSLNDLLDKINKSGIDSLSKRERALLDELRDGL